jgi:hypothetical protein
MAYIEQGTQSRGERSVVLLPQFLLYTPGGVFYDASKSLLCLNVPDLLLLILDGQTRGAALQGLAMALARGALDDEEVSVKIVPGVPVETATQICIDANSTSVPVNFDGCIQGGRNQPVIELANSLRSERLGHLSAKNVMMICQQMFLGPKGEARNGIPELYTDAAEMPPGAEEWALLENARSRLEFLLDALDEIPTERNGRGAPTSILHTAYGPAALARVMFHCGCRRRRRLSEGNSGRVVRGMFWRPWPEHQTLFREVFDERVKKVDWSRENPLLHNVGYAKLSRPGVAVTNVASTSRMRGLAEDILSSEWEKLVGEPGDTAMDACLDAGG